MIEILLLSLQIQAAPIVGQQPSIHREYTSAAVEKIQIDNSSGRVRISAGERDRVIITGTPRKFGERCSYDVAKSDPSLITVKVSKPLGEECEMDIEIVTSKDMNLDVTSGSGAIEIAGINGAVNLKVGTGSVKANGKFAKVDVKSGSGSVAIDGITGGGNVSIGSGPITLRFLDNPQGQLDIQSGNGTATLNFPKDAEIAAKLTTGNGTLVNELGHREDADFGVNVKTGSGDVQVKAY